MKKKLFLIVPGLFILLIAAVFFIYAGSYYRAGEAAASALAPDETVHVMQTDYGWLFDGPSETSALIFYPGAKVEETAYEPLLRRFAENGMDICLVKMPLRFAFFGAGAAKGVMEQASYDHWYIGGHSLGGAMAANYAAAHPEEIDGIVLLAAYPTKAIDNSLLTIIIYGSEDTVINGERLEKSREYVPANSDYHMIQGGNHAQFGDYGEQKGDGIAGITAQEQQEETVSVVMRYLRR